MAASATAHAATGTPSLTHAIHLFDQGEDDAARKELTSLLSKGSAGDAAHAHLYLALIAINALHVQAGRDEFVQALTFDPTLELPFSASPKAAVVFGQARAIVQREQGTINPPAPAQVPTPPPAPVQESAPLVIVDRAPTAPQSSPSHVVSITVGAVGLASVVAGAALLGASAVTLSSARADPSYGGATAKAVNSAHQQYAAEWCLGAGGAVVAVAVGVYLFETVRGHHDDAASASSHVASLLSEGVHF